MSKGLSTAVSICLHPLLMCTFTLGILLYSVPEVVNPFSLMSLPFLFFTTCIIPSLSIYVLKVLGSIRSVKMEDRDERVMPFFFITIYYAMNAYLFIFKIHVNETVAIILFSTFVMLLIVSLITLWFKVSIHAVGICGVLGFIAALAIQFPNGLLLYPLLAVLFLSGLVMSARLQLNAHTPAEIWSGAALGFFLCFTSLYFFG